MLSTVSLPEGIHIHDIGARVRTAFESFQAMELTRYALADWLTGAYQRVLVGERDFWPFTLRVTTNVEATLDEARRAVSVARAAASRVDGSLIEGLPQRVHVVRVRDGSGVHGFAVRSRFSSPTI